jgi:hypothetical protein
MTYEKGGKSYDKAEGTRAEVWHGTAHHTPGGLKKTDLLMNKWGRIVSKAKSQTMKKGGKWKKLFGDKKAKPFTRKSRK